MNERKQKLYICGVYMCVCACIFHLYTYFILFLYSTTHCVDIHFRDVRTSLLVSSPRYYAHMIMFLYTCSFKYLHICIYIYICICIYIYVCIYIHICVYTLHLYNSISIYTLIVSHWIALHVQWHWTSLDSVGLSQFIDSPLLYSMSPVALKNAQDTGRW